MTEEKKTHLGLSRGAWFLYPACREEGAIWLDFTILPSKVTCEKCMRTDVYKRRLRNEKAMERK